MSAADIFNGLLGALIGTAIAVFVIRRWPDFPDRIESFIRRFGGQHTEFR